MIMFFLSVFMCAIFFRGDILSREIKCRPWRDLYLVLDSGYRQLKQSVNQVLSLRDI